MFGQHLATPIGPAAGPHTQLAQNIVCAWLSGGRFIELKTVQVNDRLEIPRPCIDMEDEGYNVEWSQELRLDQSAEEYIKAWALIHILHRLLGREGRVPVGTIFNMSVGYDLEGIKSPPISRFMDRMNDASEELSGIRSMLRKRFPQFADVEIPSRLSNNVTLSTMHGCPPEEIERIASHLLEERGLHTSVKLNPTLLGRATVLGILHDYSGFHEIQIPEKVFEHDLSYGRAIELIRSLKDVAARRSLAFGVKLSNTLAVANHKSNLPGGEMYMSGRALYPLTMSLFHSLAEEFEGDLNVSYSGGADALNVSMILAAGARPVTAVSDLLKPGGYSRLLQYLENIEAEMRRQGAAKLDEFAQNWMRMLEWAPYDAITNPRYKKGRYPGELPKVDSTLGPFDCIAAPCVSRCAVCQDVPEYAWLIAQGEYDRALEVILSRNPLPGVTGYICTQLCRTRCTRLPGNYDEPIAIRALKRFAVEHGRVRMPESQPSGRRVAIIGGGPSGLSAAYFLALNGIRPVIFEAKDVVGGMMRLAPEFRLPTAIIQEDVDRIAAMGAEIRLSHPVMGPPEELLKDGFDAVYIANGFQKDTPLEIKGIGARGVIGALDFLERVRRGLPRDLGSRVLVIGGGDTAMDAARVARRVTGHPPIVVYRRTKAEMPAGEEDLQGAIEEGIIIEELASPKRVIVKHGRVTGLECIRNRPGEPDADGRRKPVPIDGSEFRIAADSVIVAVGQSPDLAFLEGSGIRLGLRKSIEVEPRSGRSCVPHVYAGGDVVRGPESIIAACADGRRAAEAICAEFGLPFEQLPSRPAVLSERDMIEIKRVRARREGKCEAREEAARCLQCSVICDKCVEVCPNRANQVYFVQPDGEKIKQSRQIVHLHELCNECGNCATFCVHQGRPYEVKPRLSLQEFLVSWCPGGGF